MTVMAYPLLCPLLYAYSECGRLCSSMRVKSVRSTKGDDGQGTGGQGEVLVACTCHTVSQPMTGNRGVSSCLALSACSCVWVRTPALTRTVQVSFVFCLLFFKWSGRVKLWYPAPWVGNTNVPHSAERKGELACVSRFLTYVMASSRMGDHGRTHKGQANEICARGVRIFCRCMRPPKS